MPLLRASELTAIASIARPMLRSATPASPLTSRSPTGHQQYVKGGHVLLDAVILALHQLLKIPPALVVSGINAGANLGENLIYSGTVAAALEATLHGVPAVAVSLASRKNLDFSVAAAFAAELAAKVIRGGTAARV